MIRALIDDPRSSLVVGWLWLFVAALEAICLVLGVGGDDLIEAGLIGVLFVRDASHRKAARVRHGRP